MGSLWRNGAGAAVCLLAVAALLFWPVLFQGKVIVPGDIAANNPFLLTARGLPAPPQNTLLSDQIEQFYVWHTVAADSLQTEGRLPLWNPYIFTGQPLVANSQSSLFYPPNLLLRFLSPGKVATLRVFFNIVFAGLFTFLFCRRLDISRRGSLFAALTFSFSGPVVVWVGFPLCNVLVCLPFLLWAGEKLLEECTLQRTTLLGCGMGVSLLGGHPETTFQILAVFSFYFLARVLTRREPLENGWRLAASFAGAVAIGALASGIQLMPFLDFMRESATFARGGRGHAGGSFFYSGEWGANLATAVTLICPNFFGNPLDHSYLWPFTTFQNYNEQAVYFGLVPLALAAVSLFHRGRSRQITIVGILALVCLAVAWRLPLLEGISHLPVFSMAPGKRLRLPFVLLASVLAGYGLDVLTDAVRSRSRHGTLYPAAAVTGATILFFVAVFFLKAVVPPEAGYLGRLLSSVFTLSQWRSYLPLGVAVAAAAAVVLALRSDRGSAVLPQLLILLAVTELTLLAWGYNPTVAEEEILPAAPAVQDLKKRKSQPFRILTTDGYFYPNYGAAYGIADVAGYDAPVYQEFSDLYLAQGGRSIGGQIDSRQEWEPGWPLVDFLNVKYVISPRDLSPDRFRMLYENRFFAVYENLRAMPRAFLVYESETVADRKEMLRRIIGGEADLRKKVLLEEDVPRGGGHGGGTDSSSVVCTSFTTDEVVLQLSAPRNGFLVMSDLQTPDWEAVLDGRGVKLYRANYAYRAVDVPAGSHSVIFRYRPRSFSLGAAMTASGIAVVVTVAAVPLLRGGRRKSNSS